jgi:hypothetical protein
VNEVTTQYTKAWKESLREENDENRENDENEENKIDVVIGNIMANQIGHDPLGDTAAPAAALTTPKNSEVTEFDFTFLINTVRENMKLINMDEIMRFPIDLNNVELGKTIYITMFFKLKFKLVQLHEDNVENVMNENDEQGGEGEVFEPKKDEDNKE